VLSPANTGQEVPDGYHLTFGRKPVQLEIKDWWFHFIVRTSNDL